jgi:nitroreductase
MIGMLMAHSSVRKFEDREIEAEKIDTIIQAARWSATSSHFQAYTIIRVQDSIKRRKIADLAGGQKWVEISPLFLVFCANLRRSKRFWNDLDTDILGNTEMFMMAVVDASLAAQKAFIAAQAMGLGGVYIGGIRNDLEEVSRLLDLPELVCPLFGMCLGYPAEKNTQKPRLPEEVIYKEDSYSEDGDEKLIAAFDDVMYQYYAERTGGEKRTTWTEHCAESMMARPREEIGGFIKGKGFALI